jgi:NTE family protein
MEREQLRPGISMAISGGGFRAALFHLGAFWRLNELGYLPKLTRVCSVSGGSITAGVLGYRWGELNFDDQGVATNFIEKIVNPLRNFCSLDIDVSSILGGWLSIFKTPSDLLEKRYRKHLFNNATLQDLPSDDKDPRFIIYATSLQTGASVRFSKPYLAEYHLGRLFNPNIPLAKAVAASCAFPPVLTPLILETDPNAWQKDKGADRYDDVYLRRKMYLSDGGVYDNLGLEAAWRFETVLVSDAGAPFDVKIKPWILKVSQLKKVLRVLDITVEQTRALRKRRLIQDFVDKVRKGTYWGIATNIDDYELPDAMVKDNKLTGSLQKIPTRLNSISNERQGHLINWGYALADTAIRRRVLEEKVAKGCWPLSEYPLG